MNRCPWASGEYLCAYHDQEWGVPIHDDRKLFEFLILEGAQAGLNWNTILTKRLSYRTAFDGFDPAMIAHYDEKRINELLQNPGIIRNRRKIESAIRNARVFLIISGVLQKGNPFRIVFNHYLKYQRKQYSPKKSAKN
jgi:DNA-3-methyladenine glycosylase I